MKLSILGIISSLVTCTSGFVVPAIEFRSARIVSSLFAYELIPEIDGGEELVALSTSPVSRMKTLGEVAGMTSKDGKVCKFWMTAVGEGALIKEYRATLLKDASKKANFPGFRKVREKSGFYVKVKSKPCVSRVLTSLLGSSSTIRNASNYKFCHSRSSRQVGGGNCCGVWAEVTTWIRR